MKQILCVLVLSLIALTLCADDCKPVINGYEFDLNPLKNLGKITFRKEAAGFEFAVCGNVHAACGLEDCAESNSFSGCVENGEQDFCLGNRNPDTEFLAVITVNDVIRLQAIYGGGDHIPESLCPGGLRSNLVIEIVCDPNIKDAPETFSVQGPECSSGNTIISFPHASGCPVRVISKGLSTGSIMLIIIFVGFAVYLIGGVVFNLAVRKESGTNLIPNKSFWLDFPSLVKDGFNFMLCKKKAGYENIE